MKMDYPIFIKFEWPSLVFKSYTDKQTLFILFVTNNMLMMQIVLFNNKHMLGANSNRVSEGVEVSINQSLSQKTKQNIIICSQ